MALDTIADSGRTVTERVSALQSMGSEVNKSTAVSLCRFIGLHPTDSEHNLGGLRYLKNEILNVLRNQHDLPVDLADTLVVTATDKDQDLVSRDYAVQHLAALCRRISDEGAQVPAHAVSLLFRLTTEKSTVAGTALVALHRLSDRPIGIDREAINSIALNMACDSQCSPAVRMSALQVCSQRHISAVLSTAENIALSNEPISLRISALAVIGALGEPSRSQKLSNIRADDPLVKDAVAAAVRSIQQRSISMY
ncbi:MAG: hypothetical protein ACXWJX_01870 [Limisphaerales bacterium]